MVKLVGDKFKLLVIIVKKNLSRKVVKACKKAGAEGGTVLNGRGTGQNEKNSFFGIKVEPEKDIILCITPNEIVDDVISAAEKAAELDQPGTGIAFVINSKNICGIAHLLDDDFSSSK